MPKPNDFVQFYYKIMNYEEGPYETLNTSGLTPGLPGAGSRTGTRRDRSGREAVPRYRRRRADAAE